MSSDEFVDKAKDQRRRGRLDEALVSGQKAIELDPDNVDAYWIVALTELDRKNPRGAFPMVRKVTELAPHAGIAWNELGKLYLRTNAEDRDDRAQAAFEEAVENDPDLDEPLIELAKIYEKKKDADAELRVREALLALVTKPDTHHLNRLGILHHDRGAYLLAIYFYRRVAMEGSGTAGWFNLGLAYNEDDVSQDVDAIDCWRRVLTMDPAHQKAGRMIDKVLPKLHTLAGEVRAGVAVLPSDEHYTHYLNPFILMQLEADGAGPTMDVKVMQKARKRTLQELDLSEGRLGWLPGLTLDRSRAMRVMDEASDAVKGAFHTHLLKRPALLEFLSTGSLEHFLIPIDDRSTDSPLAFLDEVPGFAEWLSPIFAAQFDLVLTRAIMAKNLKAIECMMDGRRWVLAGDEEKCYQNSLREVDRQIQPMRDAAAQFERRRVTDFKDFLGIGGAAAFTLLGKLNAAFHRQHSEAVGLIRDMSLTAHNKYGDTDLAFSILTFGSVLSSKSAELKTRVEEDLRTLHKLRDEQNKHKANLKFGNRSLTVDTKGIRFGDDFIAATKVRRLRWGMLITVENGKRTHDYSFFAGDESGPGIKVGWRMSDDLEAQGKHFTGLINAALHYLSEPVVLAIRQSMDQGETVRIGAVRLSSEGIQMDIKGWFSSKPVTVPWKSVRSKLENGTITVFDPAQRKVAASMSLFDTDNAMILHMMINS